MIIFINKEWNEAHKIFLVPKDDKNDGHHFIEITIDYPNSMFVAKKIVTAIDDEKWIVYKHDTFPSSLLNEFLRHGDS